MSRERCDYLFGGGSILLGQRIFPKLNIIDAHRPEIAIYSWARHRHIHTVVVNKNAWFVWYMFCFVSIVRWRWSFCHFSCWEEFVTSKNCGLAFWRGMRDAPNTVIEALDMRCKIKPKIVAGCRRYWCHAHTHLSSINQREDWMRQKIYGIICMSSSWRFYDIVVRHSIYFAREYCNAAA